MAGYPIAQNSVSRILSGERQAGPDACIAIAYGLGIPREEVFRARGWLLREPEEIVEPNAAPWLRSLARAANELPEELQEPLFHAWEAMLEAVQVNAPALQPVGGPAGETGATKKPAEAGSGDDERAAFEAEAAAWLGEIEAEDRAARAEQLRRLKVEDRELYDAFLEFARIKAARGGGGE